MWSLTRFCCGWPGEARQHNGNTAEDWRMGVTEPKPLEASLATPPSGENAHAGLVLEDYSQAAPPTPCTPLELHHQQDPNALQSKLKVQFAELTFHALIGKGSFKQVYRGKWNNTNVAIVAMRRGGLVTEARLMQQLGSHPNLCQFYRWSTDARGNEYVVCELVPFGSLDKVLSHFGPSLRNRSKLMMCEQICHAMTELAAEGVLHRDLAARNILVQSMQPVHVKVSDFGLARVGPATWEPGQAALPEGPSNGGVVSGSGRGSAAHHAKEEETPLVPVRWSAPEVLRSGGGWSEKSDVYSYGIAMWEIFSNGAEPYASRSDLEAAAAIVGGELLPRPKNCPQPVYSLMLDCWAADPRLRPSFRQIADVYRRWREATLAAKAAGGGGSGTTSPAVSGRLIALSPQQMAAAAAANGGVLAPGSASFGPTAGVASGASARLLTPASSFPSALAAPPSTLVAPGFPSRQASLNSVYPRHETHERYGGGDAAAPASSINSGTGTGTAPAGLAAAAGAAGTTAAATANGGYVPGGAAVAVWRGPARVGSDGCISTALDPIPSGEVLRVMDGGVAPPAEGHRARRTAAAMAAYFGGGGGGPATEVSGGGGGGEAAFAGQEALGAPLALGQSQSRPPRRQGLAAEAEAAAAEAAATAEASGAAAAPCHAGTAADAAGCGAGAHGNFNSYESHGGGGDMGGSGGESCRGVGGRSGAAATLPSSLQLTAETGLLPPDHLHSGGGGGVCSADAWLAETASGAGPTGAHGQSPARQAAEAGAGAEPTGPPSLEMRPPSTRATPAVAALLSGEPGPSSPFCSPTAPAHSWPGLIACTANAPTPVHTYASRTANANARMAPGQMLSPIQSTTDSDLLPAAPFARASTEATGRDRGHIPRRGSMGAVLGLGANLANGYGHTDDGRRNSRSVPRWPPMSPGLLGNAGGSGGSGGPGSNGPGNSGGGGGGNALAGNSVGGLMCDTCVLSMEVETAIDPMISISTAASNVLHRAFGRDGTMGSSHVGVGVGGVGGFGFGSLGVQGGGGGHGGGGGSGGTGVHGGGGGGAQRTLAARQLAAAGFSSMGTGNGMDSGERALQSLQGILWMRQGTQGTLSGHNSATENVQPPVGPGLPVAMLDGGAGDAGGGAAGSAGSTGGGGGSGSGDVTVVADTTFPLQRPAPVIPRVGTAVPAAAPAVADGSPWSGGPRSNVATISTAWRDTVLSPQLQGRVLPPPSATSDVRYGATTAPQQMHGLPDQQLQQQQEQQWQQQQQEQLQQEQLQQQQEQQWQRQRQQQAEEQYQRVYQQQSSALPMAGSVPAPGPDVRLPAVTSSSAAAAASNPYMTIQELHRGGHF